MRCIFSSWPFYASFSKASSIRGRGQILREEGPDFCSREGGSKNSPGRGIKLFFQGGGRVGGKYKKCHKIFERAIRDCQKSSCFGCLEKKQENISKNY